MTGNGETLQRACFVLKVREALLPEFLEAHRNVWPEYLHAFEAAGIRQYTSWVTPDGLFVGYIQAADPAAALARLAATDVDARWQETMADYFEDRPGTTAQGLAFMTEAFDLTDAHKTNNRP